jgi:predicted nuclease with TOPRIM domain
MATDPSSDVVRWVQEGERLFGQLLRRLHHCREAEMTTEALANDNRRLQADIQMIREELHQLRAERVEAAESLRAIAEHVTRLATAALQRLGRPVA